MYSSSVEDTDVKSLSSRSMINNKDVIIAGPVRGIIVGPRPWAPDSYEKINGAAFFSILGPAVQRVHSSGHRFIFGRSSN